jgi:hypothetical protein
MHPGPSKEVAFHMQCPEIGTVKIRVPVSPESTAFYVWGMAQQALENIKKTRKTLTNSKQCALQQIRIEVQGQHDESMSQKDVTNGKYESMNQLAEHDREVKIITTNKPRWAKDESTFHFYYLQDVSTGHTMQVQQTTTTETMWREAQRVIGLMDKEAKLESIQVPLDMLGNIEEFTSTNVGPHPLGELAKQHRKITIRTQKTVQLKEKQAGNSQAKLFGATVKAGSRSAQNSETSQEPHRKKGHNDPTRSGQPTDEQDKGSQKWDAVERQQKLLLQNKRDDKSRKQEEPEGGGKDSQEDFLAQIDAQKQKDQTEATKHTGVTKVSVSETGDSDQ